MTTYCVDCDEVLTLDEQTRFDFRCKICDYLIMNRLHHWRSGGDDKELNTMFTGNNFSVH